MAENRSNAICGALHELGESQKQRWKDENRQVLPNVRMGNAQTAFDHWLDTGMTIKADTPPQDEPCLFAGSGFSESDSATEDA